MEEVLFNFAMINVTQVVIRGVCDFFRHVVVFENHSCKYLVEIDQASR